MTQIFLIGIDVSVDLPKQNAANVSFGPVI